jgi:hypothetical protein
MVEGTGRKPKSADYKGTEVVPVSRNDLYNLKELDIKKEYLISVVLPFAHKRESVPVDTIIEDRAGFGYIRRLVAEELPSGSIGLYDITTERKAYVSEYSVSFDANGRICAATEDRDLGGKHVSAVYEVNETQDGYKRSFEAHPTSVTVILKQGNRQTTKLYVDSGFRGDDVLEEIKFPNNFVQVITLRADE